ncbi:short transient receptor potential channel 7 isoform X3 [Patella vulgata]|uniref:short transient receptor potential channel 7 isoform X3 n=1 Tax=Patella vulgata TaxID=6465 RepID=UPI0021808BC8|nr:short transient receptor potential channel 7 isoform X3 [Patella vulgata]
MSKTMLPSCMAYNSPYSSPSRGLDYSTTDKRTATMPSQSSLFTIFEDVQLTDEERVFLNAAYLGDVGVVRMCLEDRVESNLNIGCVDYMGRNALHLAIDSEKMDVIEILLDNLSFNCIDEALLHAISKGAVKIVKTIIEHPNFMAGEVKLKRMGGGDAFFRTEEKSQFPPDITPLILAAHYNNHEIIQMFISRNHTIPKPHPISCTCADCVTKQNYDSLKRSRSRLNAYRALASPAYMALSSPDPIMNTFELRQEMMKLQEVEKEFKSDYLSLVEQCMNFACELMDLCRGTTEVEAVLSEGSGEASTRDPLFRLKMAVSYEERKFVAHPNCQQHMTSIWYGSEMGFLQSLSWYRNLIYLILFLPTIPFLCIIYIFAPNSKFGAIMRCPVTKFITHTTSHICFLTLLSAATFRITESGVSITTTDELDDARYSHLSKDETINSLLKETLRPASTLITHVQICIVFWILGLLWIECKQVYNSGARSYVTDYYNSMDFSVLSMYLASYVLRFFTEYKVSEADSYFNGTLRARELLMQGNYTYFNILKAEIKDPRNSPYNYFMEASRFAWESNDPEIVSDVLFAIANVISFARTTYLMPAFEVLGPLQISLGRMIGDITRFMVLFTLVLFAFMVGLHNLYWYYGAQKIKMEMNGYHVTVHAAKAFQGLRQTFFSLFWSMFGQVSINDISVKHPRPDGVYTSGSRHLIEESSTAIVEGVGVSLFGLYHVVIIIVLINMLIAMMSHSFEDIQTDCDVEWKFARNKLWLNYMDDGSTLPVPFNMIPTPKSFLYAVDFCNFLFKRKDTSILEYGRKKKQTFLKKRRETVLKNLKITEEETSYIDIMHRLVKRYLFKLERAKDEKEKLQNMTGGGGNCGPMDHVEIFDPSQEETPPPVPDIPSRFQFATPLPGEEDPDERNKQIKLSSPNHQQQASKRRQQSKSQQRRPSAANLPIATTLAIPQLDAIMRQQKLLDLRLQQLQSDSKDNNRMMDDVEFIRRLMSENQKALCNVVQALSNIQGEIVNLAQCLRPTPSKPAQPIEPTPNAVTNAHPKTNTTSMNRSASVRKRSAPDEGESKVSTLRVHFVE